VIEACTTAWTALLRSYRHYTFEDEEEEEEKDLQKMLTASLE